VATPLIEYQNITVCRGEKVALDAITLSINVGEHVAILGPNGCGKSTLIKTMTRECYPRLDGPESWMRIMGKSTWNVFDLWPMLGIVSNDLMQSCTRDYPAREIVLSGFFSSIGIWPNHHVTPEMERKTDELLKQLEIEHLAERNTNELSSGEARRVLIARALIHSPKALVLDEPTTSLDFHATHELREILRKIAQAGTSMVMVTHHLPDIIPEISRVIVMKDGRVSKDGPKSVVLTSQTLSDLFQTSAEIVERDGYYQVW
jgi:iron complex transport system ATP-binding protein